MPVTNRRGLRALLAWLDRSPWLPAIVFIASILYSTLLWSLLPASLRPGINLDYVASYQLLARNILEGPGLIDREGRPAIRYPPGYPLILTGIFAASDGLNMSEETVLSAFIFVCLGLTSAFVFLLARTAWKPLPALASSLLWTTYPFGLWLAMQRGSESSFMVVFLGALTVFWRAQLYKRRALFIYFSIGLLLGIAMLIRPIALGMGLVVSAILWFTARGTAAYLRLSLIAVMLLGNLVAVLPWQMWMYTHGGKGMLLSTGGKASMVDGLTFTVNTDRAYRLEISVPAEARAVQQAIFDQRESLKSFGDIARVLGEQLRIRPLAVIQLYAIKAARSWYASDSGRLEKVALVIQVPYLLLVLLALGRSWRCGGIARQMAVGTAFIALYFWAMTLLALSILRYMIPVMALTFALLPAALRPLSVEQREP